MSINMASQTQSEVETAIKPELKQVLQRQGYQILGKSTFVKKCYWTHQRLRNNRNCYKKYYGIESHRCIQATASVICNFSCVFCWRTKHDDVGLGRNYTEELRDNKTLQVKLFDSPEAVVENLIRGWKRIISGYKADVPPELWEEAEDPKHVALSLNGEPMIYPFMADLVRLLKERGMTVFIVTNGSFPERIREFKKKNSWPTQLYVTLPPPNKEDFYRTFRPNNTEQWDKIMETLDLLGSVTDETRKVARLTVAKGYNLKDVEGYVDLIRKMDADFVEIKGVVHVGAAMTRLERSAMPSHEEVKQFSEELAKLLNYEIVAESPDSTLVILTSGKKPLCIPGLEANYPELTKTKESIIPLQ